MSGYWVAQGAARGMTASSIDWQQRLSGGLVGLLVGDALGVPYEFHPPEAIPTAERIEFIPPAGFRRAHPGVPPGTWSDDGAQALVLLDSLLVCGDLDLGHFATGLRRWLLEGFYAVDRAVFDVGVQTSTALNRLAMGASPESSGPADERHNGNGSLMRVLPLALWHRGDDLTLMTLAARQSLPTHGHLRAQIACAMYCLWARAILDQEANPWEAAVTRLHVNNHEELFPDDEVGVVLDPRNAASIRGTGYVLDTLWSAKAVVEGTSDFESCVRRAIALGHDTDTTAAVDGGIGGLLYGLNGIPERWLTALRARTLYEPLMTRLLVHSEWRSTG